MNTQTLAPATSPAALEVALPLREHVVEQVMRCSSDMAAAAEFYSGEPGTPEARSSVGRFLRSHENVILVAGSPLIVWAHGGQLTPNWRAAYPPALGSSYAYLEFLTELYPDHSAPATSAFDTLTALEARSLAALAA